MQRILLTSLFVLLFSFPAVAQKDKLLPVPPIEIVNSSSGWFIGAGFGDAQTEVVGHDRSNQIAKVINKLGFTVLTATGGEHDNATTQMIRGGYSFNPYLAVEGSYQEIEGTNGTFNVIALNPGATTISGRVKSEYWIASLAIIGRYRLLSWLGIYSKIGIHHWNHEIRLSGNGNGININKVNEHDGTNGLYGLGIDLTPFTTIPVVKNISIHLGWEMFYGVENEDGIDTSSMTLQYRF